MSMYDYSPLLPPPGRPVEIDPLNPAVRMALKILKKAKMSESAAFRSPSDGCYRFAPVAETDAAVLYLHGGAFYLPAQISSLRLAKIYAEKLGAEVIVPEYPLLPESRAEHILTSCVAAYEAVRGKYKRVLLYGESCGAALVAGVLLLSRDRGMRMPEGQVLVYPVLDDRAELYDSHTRYVNAAWTEKANTLMWRAYLKDVPPNLLPYLAPMRFQDMHGLPKAYVEPQGIDVLRDEGTAYARRLREAGVETELNIIEGSYHLFDADLSSPLVTEVIERRIKAMKKMLK